jgi:hypothetical protein
MKKSIIYLILLVILSLSIHELGDYPTLQFMAGLGWCVVGFLLAYNITDYLLNKTKK